MSETEEKDKCKALLYVIGQDGRDIYNTFIIQEGNKDKIAPLFTQLERYCIPRKKCNYGTLQVALLMESNRQIKTLKEEETIHALKRKSSHSKHSKQQQPPRRKKFE